MRIVSIAAPDRVPYQGWSPCMQWCINNCTEYWQYDTEGVFIFASDKDATAFLLVWG